MSSEKHANLGLHKWAPTDGVLRTEFNDNFAKLDEKTAGIGDLALIPEATVVDALKDKDDKIATVNAQLANIAIDLTTVGAGDGVADDRPALQSAINAVNAAGGGSIYLPEGYTFLMKTRTEPNFVLKLKNKVSITGGGILKISNNFGDYHSIFSPSENLENVKISGITIDENTTNNPMTNMPDATTQNYRVAIYLWGKTFKNITIEGVTIKDSVGVWQITTERVENFKVKNNRIIYTTNIPSINYDRTSIYFGGVDSEITGNHLKGSAYANTAIELHGTRIVCTNNIVNDYATGMFIVNDSQVLLAGESLEGVIVSNNVFQDVKTGIMPWLEMSRPVRNLKISNNTVNLSPTRKGRIATLGGTGIGLYPIWGTTTLQNIEISDNLIFHKYEGDIGAIDSVNKTYGISIPSFATGLNFNLENLTIKGNTIVNPINGGIRLDLGSGGASSMVKGLLISGNAIKNAGQLVDSSGITISGVKKFFNCKVENNTISDDRIPNRLVNGIAYLNAGVTTDDALNHLQIINNNVILAGATNYLFSKYLNFESHCYVRQLVQGSSLYGHLLIKAKVGSVIEDTLTGRVFRQIDAPSGTKWVSENYSSDTPTNLNTLQYYRVSDTIRTTATPTTGGIQGWFCYQSGVACKTAWAATTPYNIGDRINNASGVYECTVAGTSGTTAPTGTGASIVDGTVTWKFLDWVSLFKTYGTIG